MRTIVINWMQVIFMSVDTVKSYWFGGSVQILDYGGCTSGLNLWFFTGFCVNSYDIGLNVAKESCSDFINI